MPSATAAKASLQSKAGKRGSREAGLQQGQRQRRVLSRELWGILDEPGVEEGRRSGAGRRLTCCLVSHCPGQGRLGRAVGADPGPRPAAPGCRGHPQSSPRFGGNPHPSPGVSPWGGRGSLWQGPTPGSVPCPPFLSPWPPPVLRRKPQASPVMWPRTCVGWRPS